MEIRFKDNKELECLLLFDRILLRRDDILLENLEYDDQKSFESQLTYLTNKYFLVSPIQDNEFERNVERYLKFFNTGNIEPYISIALNKMKSKYMQDKTKTYIFNTVDCYHMLFAKEKLNVFFKDDYDDYKLIYAKRFSCDLEKVKFMLDNDLGLFVSSLEENIVYFMEYTSEPDFQYDFLVDSFQTYTRKESKQLVTTDAYESGCFEDGTYGLICDKTLFTFSS